MQLIQSRLFLLASIFAVVIFSAAFGACSDDDDDAANDEATTAAAATTTASGGGEIDYGSLSGEINIDGSSTVYPITAAMAEEFDAVAGDVLVNVAFSGTGGGFTALCAGDIEIADASRKIKDNDDPATPGEVQNCAANGIEDLVEFQVGIDALTVMVNPANDFVECLTIDQLHGLFMTGGFTNWNQVDPTFPDQSITFYYPGTDSGTFDYFLEQIITGPDETATHRGDGTASEDDNILATGIEGDENALGYFGFAYYQEAGSNLNAVAIDDGDGCVEPTFENALDGSYAPLSRPLYIYTREAFLSEPDSAVLGFVNFYLDETPTIVPEVGYINIPDDLLAEQKTKIEPFLP